MSKDRGFHSVNVFMKKVWYVVIGVAVVLAGIVAVTACKKE